MSDVVVSFWVSGGEYALPVEVIREVVQVEEITPVPRAAAAARGLTCVRGRVVPVIDAAVALGREPSRIDAQSRLVLVEDGARVIGVLVDRVGGLRPPIAGAEPPPVIALPQLLGAGA